MMRLHLHYEECITEEGKTFPTFVKPEAVDKWVKYLTSTFRNFSDEPEYAKNTFSKLYRNLGYRLQFIEIIAGLIIHHYEQSSKSKGSTLHSVIEQMFIQQFCMYCDSFFEGLGAYLFKINQFKHAPKVTRLEECSVALKEVKEDKWIKALKDCLDGKKSLGNRKPAFGERLRSNNVIRDLIHMDRKIELDFTSINFEHFKTAFESLQEVLLAADNNNEKPESILTEHFIFEPQEKSKAIDLTDLLKTQF